MRRVFLLVMAVLIFVSFGCAPKDLSGVSKYNKVVVWHWMTDREDAFNKLAEKYKEAKGVDVKFELYAPSNAYSRKVRGAAQTNRLPDIYGILAEQRDIASFIDAGHVLNLTSYMDAEDGKWRNTFFKRPLSTNEFLPGNDLKVEPGIYGVPLDVMNIQMLYNKDLFKKAGLDPDNPPRSWEDFLEAGKNLKVAGIQGLVSGWGEVWMIDCFMSNYAYNIMGEKKFIDTIKGDVAYTDPDWIRVFTLFKEMKENNLLAQGVVTMVNKHAEQMFANQRAALAFNGSWCVNVYNGMNPDLNYGVLLPPAVSDKNPVMIWGGAGSSFMVNAKTKNQEETIEFLKWLTAKEQQVYLAKKTKNLPSNKESLSAISKVLLEFADDMDRTTHPNSLPVSELPKVIEARDKGIQSIIIGEKTPEEVAVQVQAIKVRELRKNRN
ncbi:ABC transporter substrate-binding protein [Candidatus Omnitrophota bacterium]